MSSRCYDPFLTARTEEASWSAPSTGPGRVELAGAHPPGDGPSRSKGLGQESRARAQPLGGRAWPAGEPQEPRPGAGQGQAGGQAIFTAAPSTEPQPSEASALADLPGSECDQGLGGEKE